jgi:hypothetical protein
MTRSYAIITIYYLIYNRFIKQGDCEADALR